MQNRSLRGSATPALFLLMPLALVVGGWTVGRQMTARGEGFYERGKSIVGVLDRFARASKARDRQGVAALFAARYPGQALGFGALALRGEKDGVRTFAQQSNGSSRDRDAAVSDWLEYLDSFDAIDAVE